MGSGMRAKVRSAVFVGSHAVLRSTGPVRSVSAIHICYGSCLVDSMAGPAGPAAKGADVRSAGY